MRLMRVHGHSMTPTLADGEVVLVRAGHTASLRRGDIVAARPTTLAGKAFVKRIAGLPHERLTLGQRTWQLGPDEYLLLGDHAEGSLDSRTLGPVTQEELIGRVWLRVWPPHMRRWMVTGILAISVIGFGAVGRGDPSGLPLRQRAFQFSYTAELTDLPSDAREIRVWIPLARTRANQQVLARRITTTVPYEIRVEPKTGNEILYFVLTAPVPRTYTVDVTYDTLVQEDPTAFHSPPSEVPNATAASGALQPHLQPESLVIIDEAVRRFSAEATVGRTSDVERARGIYDFVIAHMSYDKTTPGWGRGDTRRACLIGKGNCTDFHSLFISMARAAGLPARFVIGATIPQAEEGDIPGYHCWAEVYTREAGWIPVDASEAWKHPERKEYYFGTPDPNKLLISVGRDLTLVPPQRGGPLNYFLEPYVEVDGQPFQTGRVHFHFRSQPHKEGST